MTSREVVSFEMAVWPLRRYHLLLAVSHHSPGLNPTRPRHVRKLPVTCCYAVVFTGHYGFLNQLQLAIHNLDAIWQKRWRTTNIPNANYFLLNIKDVVSVCNLLSSTIILLESIKWFPEWKDTIFIKETSVHCLNHTWDVEIESRYCG